MSKPVAHGLGLELGLEPILPQKSLSATSQGSTASAKSHREELGIDSLVTLGAPEPEVETAGCLSYICCGICSCLYTVLIAPWVCLFQAIFCSCCEEGDISFATSSYAAIEAQLRDGGMIDLYTPDAQGISPLQHLLQRGGLCNNFSNLVPLLVARAAPNANQNLINKFVNCVLGQEDINQRIARLPRAEDDMQAVAQEVGPQKTPLVQHLFIDGHYSLVLLALQAGADPNAKDQRILTDEHGHQTVDGTQRTLLALICSREETFYINETDDQGRRLTRPVAVAGRFLIEWVLSMPGVRLNERDQNGHTPLMICVENNRLFYAEALLRRNGTNVNGIDNAGNTALHLAARTGYLRMVQLVYRFGANLGKVNNRGDTALHAMARLDPDRVADAHKEIIAFLALPRKTLASKHIDVHALNDDGLNPLHVAAIHNNTKICEGLLAAGAGINFPAGVGTNVGSERFIGKTALHLAALMQHSFLVEGLLKWSADPHAEDAGGKIPLFCAGKMPIRSTLQKKGPYDRGLEDQWHYWVTINYLTGAMCKKGNESVRALSEKAASRANSLNSQIEAAHNERAKAQAKAAADARQANSMERRLMEGKT